MPDTAEVSVSRHVFGALLLVKTQLSTVLFLRRIGDDHLPTTVLERIREARIRIVDATYMPVPCCPEF